MSWRRHDPVRHVFGGYTGSCWCHGAIGCRNAVVPRRSPWTDRYENAWPPRGSGSLRLVFSVLTGKRRIRYWLSNSLAPERCSCNLFHTHFTLQWRHMNVMALLKSPTTRLFHQELIQTYKIENTKDYRWIPLTKGPVMGKARTCRLVFEWLTSWTFAIKTRSVLWRHQGPDSI